MDERSFLDPERAEVPGELVVGLKPEVSRALEVSVPSGPSRGVGSGVFDPATEVSAAVEQLAGLEEVAYVEPVMLREAFVTPNDPQFAQQWGLTKIRGPEAWDRTTGDPAVIVAVVDTGIDLNHPELVGLLVPGQDMVDFGPTPGPPQPGWVWEGDFNGRDNVPQDEVGHGTHVAGTIACPTNDGVGVAGVTWSCRLMPVKVLNRARRLSDNRISGFGSSVDIAAGIRWAADHGARVINLSLGGPGADQVTADAVAYAGSRGCLVVAAMGNTGNSAPQFPAAFPGVLAVAAVDRNDVRAPFSSMGAHVAVSAPGVDVLSTVWDNGHATMSGTSMASPHVAGVAALLFSCRGSLTAAQVRQAIVETARPLRDNPGDAVPNDRYGAGLVDARAALDKACPRVSRPIIVCGGVVTRPVSCEPQLSRVIVCRTVQVACQQVTRPVTCQPSQLVICQPQTRLITCQPTNPVTCDQRPSRLVCPSTMACPSGPVCGLPIQPIQPELDEFDDDPYGTDYGDQ